VPKIDPDELLASKVRLTGTGCTFAQMRARLPPDLDAYITKWLNTDQSLISDPTIAAAVSDFGDVYELDFSTHVTEEKVARHRPSSMRRRKCATCGIT
jgi:hypothetical protein